MKSDRGNARNGRPSANWTAADRARHRATLERFRNWQPSPEELIASGEATHLKLHGEYRGLRPFVEETKRARETAKLTLAEVSQRSGIDQPALSRLENGHNKNPTLDTLWRYAAAVGRRLVLTTETIRDTRPKPRKRKQVRAARVAVVVPTYLQCRPARPRSTVSASSSLKRSAPSGDLVRCLLRLARSILRLARST